MSACPKIAQSLYTARHDKMLRPYYHYLLSTYDFKEESDHKRPMVSTKITDACHREIVSQNKLEHWIPYGEKSRKTTQTGLT